MSEFDASARRHDHSRNGYDMTLDDINQLTAALLEQHPPTINDQYVCYAASGDNEFADIGRFVERTVFEKRFGNTASDMHGEYGPYERASRFFISIDAKNKTPAGVLRIIQNSDVGLKSVNDLAEAPLHLSTKAIQDHHRIATLDNCWDIGTVAAAEGYSSGAASIQLYRGMYLAAVRDDIEHVVSVVDVKVLDKLTKYLGIPFEPLVATTPFEYLGSENSQAVYGYVPSFYESMDKKRRTTIAGFIARKALKRLVYGSEDHAHMPDLL